MRSVKVVTGYVPIPHHPRSVAEYGALGERLGNAVSPVAPLKAYYTAVEQCWLFKATHNKKVTHSEGDNAAKNTLAYHCANHQKTDWLAMESFDAAKNIEVLVWIDYGIFSVPGITDKIIQEFLSRVAQADDQDIHIPGCWGTDYSISDDTPCWRFCGGVMIVPRSQAPLLDKENKIKTLKNIQRTKNVTWEVNDLARLERYTHLPIKWYQADHNETLFTGFQP